ncbi:recombinase family protein [Clostridium botulinum]|uniref:recombinase family protein n=1 Tax=Clostridium botulinum TaxID=1491 RepID=UPI00174D1BFA|nr:recombinase family protein [Clostridium botulinum]
MRLSTDAGIQQSSSITTQRKILIEYCKEYGYIIFDEYIDDSYSGTNFNRPAFQRIIQDIEDKKINLVIAKDLSCLGRKQMPNNYKGAWWSICRRRQRAS